MTHVRLLIPVTGESIELVDIRQEKGWMLARASAVHCAPSTLALFEELNSTGDDGMLSEWDRVRTEIDRLGFVVEDLPGFAPRERATSVWLTGDEVSFKVDMRTSDND
jgi:hypothetical protein